MSSLFRSRSRRSTPTAAGSRPRRPRRARVGLEALEGRQVLSVFGPELVVNSTVRNESDSDTATAPDGRPVVVWVDEWSPADHDIFAQLYNADGSAHGREIYVERSDNDDRAPAVAMNANGDWVVTYTEKVNGQVDV